MGIAGVNHFSPSFQRTFLNLDRSNIANRDVSQNTKQNIKIEMIITHWIDWAVKPQCK